MARITPCAHTILQITAGLTLLRYVILSREKSIVSLTILQSYYIPISGRANLKVLANARVDQVQFSKADRDSLVATGVEFNYEEKPYLVKAKKEVLLCAG